MHDDADWLTAAAALAARGRPRSRPNPAVGAIVVKDGRVIGRGWTRTGGRPHAEAEALAMAGDAARGATLYVTLEPCAHRSERGPACAELAAAAGLARVVAAVEDPDPRTAGAGMARIAASEAETAFVPCPAAEASLEGYLARHKLGRPHVTLKLALSLDGAIALASSESRWITGEEARAHAHLERARSDAILVGGGTLRADAPRLDVRLPGLEPRNPERWVLTRGAAPEGWRKLASPADISAMEDVQSLLVEGGAQTAAAFLAADLVDRLLIYRAPIVIGGRPGVADLGLTDLASAHGLWREADSRRLGNDRLEVYERIRCSPE
ncbi:MAG: bifunctional diaminohydroxyphosphoribosylaminopyrimidine deaminase/5-amino-6-(5-phosphoribosylamino)uracil reductase RibD [Novosphingobium sp.]|nr:bifunctional diaminohydroxyphosphoribosylaminopyrimidine deaminase/5-amino-6-(5-phosphoribosylamino)uracil reductase RibD [Novosphingobium sp.]